MGVNIEGLQLLISKFPNIKMVRDADGTTVEFFSPQPQQVEVQDFPVNTDMPSDDKLLFMSAEGLPEDHEEDPKT